MTLESSRLSLQILTRHRFDRGLDFDAVTSAPTALNSSRVIHFIDFAAHRIEPFFHATIAPFNGVFTFYQNIHCSIAVHLETRGPRRDVLQAPKKLGTCRQLGFESIRAEIHSSPFTLNTLRLKSPHHFEPLTVDSKLCALYRACRATNASIDSHTYLFFTCLGDIFVGIVLILFFCFSVTIRNARQPGGSWILASCTLLTPSFSWIVQWLNFAK